MDDGTSWWDLSLYRTHTQISFSLSLTLSFFLKYSMSNSLSHTHSASYVLLRLQGDFTKGERTGEIYGVVCSVGTIIFLYLPNLTIFDRKRRNWNCQNRIRKIHQRATVIINQRIEQLSCKCDKYMTKHLIF